MPTQPIYVETEEELTEVVERLRKAGGDEVPLVLPARARVAQSRFNFQLLREYASQMDKRVAIISSDGAVQRMAQENGLTAYTNPDAYNAATPVGPAAPVLPSGPSGPTWEKGAEAGNGAAGSATGPAAGLAAAAGTAAVVAPAVEPPPVKTVPKPKHKPSSMEPAMRSPKFAAADAGPHRGVLYLGAALILVAGLIALAVILPSASVTLVAQAKAFSTKTNFTASPGTGAIRVRVVDDQKQSSQQFKVTGQKITPATPATGTMQWINRCQTVTFDVLPGERIFGGGQTFAALTALRIPAADPSGPISIDAQVANIQTGAAGNVPARTLTSFTLPPPPNDIPVKNCIGVDNKDAIGGGTDQQSQPQLSQADYDAAQASLQTALQTTIGQDLSKAAASGEKLSDTVLYDTPTFATDHKVGDLVPGFTGTMTLRGHGTFYNSDDIRNALLTDMQSKVPTGYQVAEPAKTQTNFEVASTDPGGHMSFLGSASGFIAPKIDLAAVKAKLAAHSPTSGQQYLGTLPIQSSAIQQRPFKLPLMPILQSRIDVQYVVRAG